MRVSVLDRDGAAAWLFAAKNWQNLMGNRFQKPLRFAVAFGIVITPKIPAESWFEHL